MGYGLNPISTRLHLTIFALSLLIISSTKLTFIAEGRRIYRPVNRYQEDEKILGAHIGSRPPRCKRRCSTCKHCVAIQVPTDPQPKTGGKNSLPIDCVRGGDDNSNYKPMSWKCKCGNSIFNP